MAYAGKTLFASCEEGFVRAVYTFLTYIAKICKIKYNRTRELGGQLPCQADLGSIKILRREDHRESEG